MSSQFSSIYEEYDPLRTNEGKGPKPAQVGAAATMIRALEDDCPDFANVDGWVGYVIKTPFNLPGSDLVHAALAVSQMHLDDESAPDSLDIISEDSWWIHITLDGSVSVAQLPEPPEEAIKAVSAACQDYSRDRFSAKRCGDKQFG